MNLVQKKFANYTLFILVMIAICASSQAALAVMPPYKRHSCGGLLGEVTSDPVTVVKDMIRFQGKRLTNEEALLVSALVPSRSRVQQATELPAYIRLRDELLFVERYVSPPTLVEAISIAETFAKCRLTAGFCSEPTFHQTVVLLAENRIFNDPKVIHFERAKLKAFLMIGLAHQAHIGLDIHQILASWAVEAKKKGSAISALEKFTEYIEMFVDLAAISTLALPKQ